MGFARRYSIFLAVVLLAFGMAVLSPHFLTARNLFNLLRVSAIDGLLAVGMTFVILGRGIDLSVGSIVALSAAVIALLLGPEETPAMPVLMAVLLTLAVAGGAGAINGLITTRFRVDSFVVTLGMLTIARGGTLLLLGGRPAQIGEPGFISFARSDLFGVPVPVLCFIAIAALSWVVLNKTPYGRYLYATGSNPESAFLSGIRTNLIRFSTFGVSGVLAGLGGVLLASRLFSASPVLGEGDELNAIAAVVIGGTSLMGGRGTIAGTIAGILIIGIINNGLNLLGVSSYYQLIVRGVIVVIAIILAQWGDKSRQRR
jgi:putative xylitol transport system permease protein